MMRTTPTLRRSSSSTSWTDQYAERIAYRPGLAVIPSSPPASALASVKPGATTTSWAARSIKVATSSIMRPPSFAINCSKAVAFSISPVGTRLTLWPFEIAAIPTIWTKPAANDSPRRPRVRSSRWSRRSKDRERNKGHRPCRSCGSNRTPSGRSRSTLMVKSSDGPLPDTRWRAKNDCRRRMSTSLSVLMPTW